MLFASFTWTTMVLTATQHYKSLKNSVDLFYMIHQQQKLQALEDLEQDAQKQRDLYEMLEKKPGRPKKYTVRLLKSLEKDISLNTAAYSKARGRLLVEQTEELFLASRIEHAENPYSH